MCLMAERQSKWKPNKAGQKSKRSLPLGLLYPSLSETLQYFGPVGERVSRFPIMIGARRGSRRSQFVPLARIR